MKRFTYLSAALCVLSLLSACAEQAEFRSDTLENTSQVSSKLKDRGTSACSVMQEMSDAKRKELRFPIVDVSSNRKSFLDLSKQLAKKFVGVDSETSTNGEKHVYENGSKILRANEKTFEIEFVDQANFMDDSKITSQEVISKTKDFINEYNELGKLSDFYVKHYMGGVYTASAGTNEYGEKVSTPLHQESAEIYIHKVIKQLPVLGGIGSIKLGVRPNHSISNFRIKFLTFSSEGQTQSNQQLLSYQDAEQKAREVLQKKGKDANSFQFSCEFGYIPNSIKKIPSTLLPGYILHGFSNSNEKRVTVVVPAFDDVETMYEEKDDTLSDF